eukprot:352813-Chlamydomonas_euryale.AAC.3
MPEALSMHHARIAPTAWPGLRLGQTRSDGPAVSDWAWLSLTVRLRLTRQSQPSMACVARRLAVQLQLGMARVIFIQQDWWLAPLTPHLAAPRPVFQQQRLPVAALGCPPELFRSQGLRSIVHMHLTPAVMHTRVVVRVNALSPALPLSPMPSTLFWLSGAHGLLGGFYENVGGMRQDLHVSLEQVAATGAWIAIGRQPCSLPCELAGAYSR